MFTGIVEHVGRIEAFDKNAIKEAPFDENAIKKEALDKSAVEKSSLNKALDRGEQATRLRVNAGPLAASLTISGSIAVNGCCLTIVEVGGDTFAADLSSETLRRTSFAQMKPGTLVNLERPMTGAKEFGGHFVQGHVDAVGEVVRWETDGPNWWFGVRLPKELVRYAAMKGSIAIDGISLTVANITGDIAEAAIIPFTYTNTNLQNVCVGDAVNLEADILAKYVERILDARRPAASSALTIERLVDQGF
jgi:riboflavin synthase